MSRDCARTHDRRCAKSGLETARLCLHDHGAEIARLAADVRRLRSPSPPPKGEPVLSLLEKAKCALELLPIYFVRIGPGVNRDAITRVEVLDIVDRALAGRL
jgi:hypothetical protein